MKKILILFALAFIQLNAFSQLKTETSRKFVFDNENIFSASQLDSLNSLLSDHWKKSNDEIVLVTVKEPGEDIRDYARKFAQENNIGKSDELRGLTIALSQHKRTAGFVGNMKMGQVLNESKISELSVAGIPDLKASRFFEGMYKTIVAFIDYLE